MEQIEIEGKLVRDILVRIKLMELIKKLEEMKNEMETLEKMYLHEPDYDSCSNAIKFLC